MVPEQAMPTCQRVEEFPASGEGWRPRAHHLYWAGDPDTIAAIDHFLRHADRSNPAHL